MSNSLGLEPVELTIVSLPARRSGDEVRHFLDFVVDGMRLSAAPPLVADAHLASVLVLDWPAGFPEEDFGRLIGGAESDLPGGGVPLYVCHVCGDVECGAITARVDFGQNLVSWHDFALQDGREIYRTYPEVGPFEFDLETYLAVLGEFRDVFESQAPTASVPRRRGGKGRRGLWTRTT